MEQDRKFRNKSMHLWSIILRQRKQKHNSGERTVSSINRAGKTTATCQRTKLDHYLTLHTKCNSKNRWNVRSKTIKLPEENICGNDFFFWTWHQKVISGTTSNYSHSDTFLKHRVFVAVSNLFPLEDIKHHVAQHSLSVERELKD